MGRFYQVHNNIRYWRYILIGSILGSTMLSAVVSVANTGTQTPIQTQKSENYGGSLGRSLLNNILGADALRPKNSNSTRPQPSTGKSAQRAQVGQTFPDIQGNWAQSFIEALAARGIIAGFPDGTFRPNEPVTRAQFAAMIRQAFDRSLERPGTDFVDIPLNYWGYEAIQEAYRMGFLQGYPNNIFNPDQNIPRVQVLVALASGLDLSAPTQVDRILNANFQDATQIPSYARNSVAAATVNELVVNFPNIAFLNPNQTATRADVAAFIYQALVNAGSLPPLPPTDIASQYIVGYEPPVATPPPPPPDQTASLRQQYLLPQPPVVEELRRIVTGGSSISTPTAFGAQSGDIFVGGTYQERTRFTDEDDAGVVAGFGLGDARELVALETAVSIYDLVDDTFEDGGVSFKLHKLFGGDLAVAFGVENAIYWGNIDGGRSYYGVVSKVFPLRQRASDPLSRLTVSLGVGSGRFRSEDAIEEDDDDPNVFGSVGLRVVEPVTLIGEWTGQDLNLGASITPIPGVPFVITPAVADLTENAGDGPRFILGVGFGANF